MTSASVKYSAAPLALLFCMGSHSEELVLITSHFAAIAEATRNTTGKWLIHKKSKDIDSLWTAIAQAVRQGRLGTQAKVTTAECQIDLLIDSDGT